MTAGLILGHEWADIQRAQQGGRLSRAVDTSRPAASDDTAERRAADLALLAQHGRAGLESLGFHGVLDRLQRAGALTAAAGPGRAE